MELSLLLAKVLGLGLMLVTASMLANRRNISLLFDAYKNPAPIYITGIIETFLGLFLVVSHNIWTADFRLLITAIGWILLARGVGRIFSPERTARLLTGFKNAESLFAPLLILIFLLGAYLAYEGFAG